MNHQAETGESYLYRRARAALFAALLALLLPAFGCRSDNQPGLGPSSLRDVPAQRLAYGFTPDTDAPPGLKAVEETKLKTIQDDFDTRRKDDLLLRTVVSPDGKRALALYETGDVQPGEFRIDMYSAEGGFLRNLTPPELSGAFAPMVAWSPDGNFIAFIGRKSLTPSPSPPEVVPEDAPLPTPSVAPVFGPVQVFATEQVYVCNRDGFDLKPLTTRAGLIYFYLEWSPDAHALAALACPEEEWDAREKESKLPRGRPRLVGMDGQERLLDDDLTEAGPVWSPDSSKVATAFETEVRIYDAAGQAPTQASIPLQAPLMAASAVYDEKNLKPKSKKSDAENGKQDAKPASRPESTPGGGGAPLAQGSGTPISFSPIIRLAWPEDKSLFVYTAYVRTYASDPVSNFQRWHRLSLSIQAAAVSSLEEGGRSRPRRSVI